MSSSPTVGESSAARKGKTFHKLANRSSEKLSNSLLLHLEDCPSKVKKTRLVSEKLGKLRISKRKQEIRAYKIIHANILQSLVSNVRCFKCKRLKTLKIFHENKQDYGLAECLSLDCSFCNFKYPFWTSKRIGCQ